jgi:serine/threonine protein phosphatase 1
MRIVSGFKGRRLPPSGQAGARAYAVGDIHGRSDLLEALLATIERDAAVRPAKSTFLVFLGDYIDRGPNSAAVIELLQNYRPSYATPVFLGGNHEDVLLRVLRGDPGLLSAWLKLGGGECAASYGLDSAALGGIDERAAIDRIRAAIPPSHRNFMERCADTFRFGDYLFVHAGIRPGVPFDQQEPSDLRWIREPFLSDTQEHGLVIVHGHSIVPSYEERGNRIAIDTGAYRSGILTALAIEDENRWQLTTPVAERNCLASAM